MIVSHRHKLIFIKTLKTAGTSIEMALSKHCGPDDVVTPIFPEVEGHAPANWAGRFFPLRGVRSRADLARNLRECGRGTLFYNHIPARVAQARLPRSIWESYTKVTVERNPWDKTLSHYHMFCNAPWHRHYDPDLSITAYFDKGVFCHNAPIYCDTDGQVIVDRVLHYDRLDEQLPQLMEEHGVPFNGLPRAKAGIRTDRRHYSDVFTAGQRDRIAQIFAHEIQLHRWEY